MTRLPLNSQGVSTLLSNQESVQVSLRIRQTDTGDEYCFAVFVFTYDLFSTICLLKVGPFQSVFEHHRFVQIRLRTRNGLRPTLR
jgi:hypothetical protein